MIILVLLTGCRQNQHPETKIREFSGTTIAIPEPMPSEKTDLFDSVRFLKLEATDSSLFGHVSKMKVYKDHIYILYRHVLDEKSRTVYDRLTDNDNPVVVKYKLK